MSQKNFASYGDMETLVTEIVDKCGPYTEISYEDWLQLTPYQQEHGRWDVTDVPGADGTVSIDLMTKLWENPNPSAEFGAQDVTLANSDYDYLLVLAYSSVSNSHILPCIIIKKGKNGSLLHEGNRGTAVSVRYRNVDYSSDTVLSISDANVFENGNSSWTTGNSFIIPYIIYGIKLHHTVEIKAIAPTVSTLAEKCMLSDGVTSVEDALFTIDTASTGSSTWSSGTAAVVEIDVSKTGYVPKGIISIYKSGANNGYVCICGFYINETTQKARIIMYNPSSTSVTVTGIQVTVLYAKA